MDLSSPLRRQTLRAPLLFAIALSLSLRTFSQQAPATATLRTRARLVVLDVVVTDKNKNPIHGLKKDDFTVLESNNPQKVGSFEEHAALTAAQAASAPPPPNFGPGIFTNYTPTPVNSAVNVLLLDALNTPHIDQAYARSQLIQYLKNARPGTNTAIFTLTTQLHMLQGFTSDPEVLRKVITKQTGRSSPLLDDATGGGGPPVSVTDQMTEELGGTVPAQVLANMQTFENDQNSFQLQLRAKYTLDAMNQLARFLAGIPGRKNLIWFSGSFPLNILPDTSGQSSDPFSAIASSETEYRETTNLLARSQVAVYPIDARGLMTSPSYSAAASGSKYVHNPGAFAKDESDFFFKTADEHGTMTRMAEDTGGHAFINTNGLTEAVAQAIDAGSNYYTLAYTPTDAKWTGNYRKIQVKLAQSGYTLAYRHGYYADEPGSAYSAVTAADTATTPRTDPALMQRAMAHGAPPQTQIIFKIRVLPTTTEEESRLVEGNVAVLGKINGPYRRYAVDFAADPSHIFFTHTPEDHYLARIEFVALVYNADGTLVNSIAQTVPVNVIATTFKELLHSGIPFHQEISVPVKGQYTLRVAMHDLHNNNIGVTELPIAAVKNLPPVPVPAQSPTPHTEAPSPPSKP
ncbi:VWA domain-containing protein [Granulicella tundricola]|uniref:VWFA-related domain protein n=1 Tax=Granulicella tundricola (strain ATCC BAA-1859 / DSM 23138 / MP5ACTX9) TaxID=1198114 RepID=E8X556_GRATM|nr:VWA domain-containing protein [Granulicella tundricola]ADW68320.1 VWFA-related domain protein [Granulicella tundricola MP5ACTX9]